ncbi:MAG: DNA-binding MarR family transcriptional regulator [Gammaproteobacteria bacterium]|jgi:DNA-binding MarR family transcriptional regulator
MDLLLKDVLIALRRIVRALDLKSKDLVKEFGLTTAQLLLMQAIAKNDGVTIGNLAEQICLSQATVTTIIDRLENRGLLVRKHSTIDKRKVHFKLTAEGIAKVKYTPIPLQESFIERVSKLDEWEQTTLLSSLQRVAQMMDAEDIKAAPILDIVPKMDMNEEKLNKRYSESS